MWWDDGENISRQYQEILSQQTRDIHPINTHQSVLPEDHSCVPTWSGSRATRSLPWPKVSHCRTKVQGCIYKIYTCLQLVSFMVSTLDGSHRFFNRRRNEKYEWHEHRKEKLENGVCWCNDNGKREKMLILSTAIYHSAGTGIWTQDRNRGKPSR